ncbi:hypothetical protein P0R28_36875 [Bradyrhizobium yuanmingense]|nr:hypothetical protein [Bradyrhizobium yuanmingense]
MAPRQITCIARHREDSYRRIHAGGAAVQLNRANLARVLSNGDCLVFYKGSANEIMAFKMGVSVLSGQPLTCPTLRST